MNKWFEDWFDSDFYPKVYSNRNDEDASKLIRLILEKIPLSSNAKILDSSCGNGRHSVLFAQNGFDVTCFDLSFNLLKQALDSKKKYGLNFKIIRADIRNFFVKEKFDLIVNLFTSFGYFETDADNFSFFYNAFEMMKKDSYLFFDYFNSDYVVQNIVEYDSRINGQFEVIQKRKINNDRIEKEITIIKGSETIPYFESVKIYSSVFLMKKFQEIGFSTIDILGDYEGNVFDKTTSPRLILIMKK
jgi:SAM-dependent methyltransferase